MRSRHSHRFRKRALPLVLLAFTGLAGGEEKGAGNSPGMVLASDVKDGVRREICVDGTAVRASASAGTPRGPLISFIDSPNVTCVQPDPRKDECYVDWGYAAVTASTSQYIIGMSFYMGARVAASVSGFFQSSMYLPADMFGRGFKVKCGPPQTPDPNITPCSTPGCTDPRVLGNAYGYTIRAKETGGLGAANYGSVTCPAFMGARFFTLPPCRVLDSRSPAGPLGGPALAVSATREFVVSAASCGVPSGAWAVSVNATITSPSAPGYLTLYPGDGAAPLASSINFAPGQTRANNAVLPLASDFSGKIRVTNGSTGTVHFILDVNGYFQ